MRRLTSEEGTVVILVALLLVALLGFGAVAVDIGVMYEERRQLQNGADAAAMAAAWDCAEGLVPCATTGLQLNDTIDVYANENARDGESSADITELNLTDQFVTVETSTVSNGEGFLRHWFADVIGHETATVRAQATAAWGRAGRARTIPLTFSYCEWLRMVGSPLLLPSTSQVIKFHTPTDPSDDCIGPAGLNAPGGFGWLDPIGDGSCASDVTSDQYVGGDTGNPIPTAISPGCDTSFWSSLVGETVLIPIFSEITGTGSNAQYYIEGFAAFVVEGYRFTGGGYMTTPPPCAASTSCIKGHFVDYISYADYIDPSAGDYGVTAVVLTG